MTAVRNPRIRLDAVRAGDQQALLEALLAFVSDWFLLSERSARYPTNATEVVRLGASVESGLLAAGCDLRDLLAKSPQGRQALCDFGFQPFLEHIEGK